MSVSVNKPSHPAKTKSQRRVLDEIGCGNNTPDMSPALRKRMLELGLIKECGASTDYLPVNASGQSIYRRWPVEMPVDVHMNWCAYQALAYVSALQRRKQT